MATINQNWYNYNESRRYPLVDGISSESPQLPSDLIVDCNLWVPDLAGSSVWISSVLVTDKLITLTIQAVTPPSLAFTPVASISLVKPIIRYRPYQVKALYPGVTGWISFGVGELNTTSILFPDNATTEILPKKIQRYSGDVLYGVKKAESQTTLTGLIKLKNAGDLVFRLEDRDLDETTIRKTILIGLRRDGDTASTHERYLSKQSARPENGNCTKQPILFINDVPPDCDGNINLVFPPEIVDTRHPGDNGIILDYTLGLVDVCVNNPGVRPRDEKLCELPVVSDPVTVVVPPVPPPPTPPPEFPNGNPFNVTVCEDFSTGLVNFLYPNQTPPWYLETQTLDDPDYGLQSKSVVRLLQAYRTTTSRLVRNATYGNHQNRVHQLEVQFGVDPFTSDPVTRGVWDNIGLIYDYQSQTSYSFVSLIWLGHNGPGIPLANDPLNAMLVIGHKSVSTQHLTPYGFNGDPLGLNDGHFIDQYLFVEIDPQKPYLLQLTTSEIVPNVTTQAVVELLEIDNTFTYVQLATFTNTLNVLHVNNLSRSGILSVSSSNVYASFFSIDPQIGCEPIIFQES